MDNGNGASGSLGDILFSPAAIIALFAAAFSAACAAALSSGPLRAPMFELVGMVGGAYFVLAAVWQLRWGGPFRAVLSIMVLLFVLAFWWNKHSSALKAFYTEPHKSAFAQKTQREPLPEPKPNPQSGPGPSRRSASDGTGAGAEARGPSTASVKSPPGPPVKRDVYRKGVTVNVRARGVDSLLAEDVRSIVTDRVGAVQALRGRYVKVEVSDLYMSDQQGPVGRDFGSTKAYAVVRLVAYATDSGETLHSVRSEGASPVYFQGQAKPVDTMKKEALSDALESAFKQIP